MRSLIKISKALKAKEKELEKVRGKEYEMPFGSMRRAKISRKWDMLAREKDALIDELYSHPDYEDGMRLAEQQTVIE